MPIISEDRPESSNYVQIRRAERDKKGRMRPVKKLSATFTVPNVPFNDVRDAVQRALVKISHRDGGQ